MLLAFLTLLGVIAIVAVVGFFMLRKGPEIIQGQAEVTEELMEETGYEAQIWKKLGRFNNAIGYSDEEITVTKAIGKKRKIFTFPALFITNTRRSGNSCDYDTGGTTRSWIT